MKCKVIDGLVKEAGPTRFVVVTGGVISSVGKGILASSLAKLVEAQGYKVGAVKIDPYINVDAGTMRPTEHGEVYVTADGFEADQDLGNYERFTDIVTTHKNSITTGQIYWQVISDEREGKYDGKCVEVIPQIPLEVIRRIHEVVTAQKPDFLFIEIGATAGEYQIFPFLDAIRRMRFSGMPVRVVHLGYVPVPDKVGEQKTKPLQRSIFDLLSVGVCPDFVVGRSSQPLDDDRKNKIALNCSIKRKNVFSAYDCDLVYEVPVVLHQQGMDVRLLDEFDIDYHESEEYRKWEALVQKIKELKDEVKIYIVGKYFDTGKFTLEDSYISIIEAVKHAAWHCGAKPVIKWVDSKEFEKHPDRLNRLDDADCLIIPGGFGASGIEGKISAIKYARENKIPFLGLCYGLQLAVIEFARHKCGLADAHTTEIDPKTKAPVIDILPEQKKNLKDKNFGASMRLGEQPATLKEGTIARKYYGTENISERHRHRWEVNRRYVSELEKKGLVISGINEDKNLVEFIELPESVHPYFVATQAHPEFKSKFMKPSPLFTGLIENGIKKKNKTN